MKHWYFHSELQLAVGMLALSGSFVIERYTPHGSVSDFFQRLLLGISIVANMAAVHQMSFRGKRPAEGKDR